MNTIEGLIIIGLGAAVIAMICWGGFIEGEDQATRRLQTEAVKRGHAYWQVDEEGKTEFRWKEKAP